MECTILKEEYLRPTRDVAQMIAVIGRFAPMVPPTGALSAWKRLVKGKAETLAIRQADGWYALVWTRRD